MTIAQSSSAEGLLGDLLPWLGLLVVVVLVGGGIALGLRRRLLGGSEGSSVGFTLSDLRDRRARGEISEEEYERAHARMVRSVRATAESDSPDPRRPAGAVPPARPARTDDPHAS